jgi:putative nucleotidyltransferase with HDIG domain
MAAEAHHGSRAVFAAVAGCVICAVWFAVALDHRTFDTLTALLALASVAANLASARYGPGLWMSAGFTCSVLAIALLGPAAAFAVVALAELAAWGFERYRASAVAINVLATGLPALLAGTLLELLAPAGGPEWRLAVTLPLLSAGALLLNFGLVVVLTAPPGASVLARLRSLRALLPTVLWSIAIAASVTLIAEHSGFHSGAVVFVLGLLGTAYMARLVSSKRTDRVAASERAATMGAAMLQSLAQRDPHALRHAAAVATFAQEIAAAAGLGPRDCADAHTAGLLHDVGRALLPDGATRPGATPSQDEWAAIRRHPDLGAELLHSLGPVAEAVRSHHERPDGRGYPRGLSGEEIPEIARIVAVAEVYDTLTTGDAQREGLSSFRALVELRRVSGTQLDERFVEALASVLAGRTSDRRLGAGANFAQALAREKERLATIAS